MIRLVCLVLPIAATTAWDSSRLGRSLLEQIRSLEQSNGQDPVCTALKRGLACDGKAQEACTGECEWNAADNKCDLGQKAATEVTLAMMGANNPISGLMQKSTACGQETTQPKCSENNECEWQEDNGVGKCDVSGSVAMQLMLGMLGGGGNNTQMMGLVQKSMACSGSTIESNCTQDTQCEWKADETGVEKCELNATAAMMLMFGEGEGDSSMMGMIQKQMACGGKKTQQTCNGECKWDAAASNGAGECGLDATAAMQAMTGGSESSPLSKMAQMAGDCSKNKQQDCTGDCRWETSKKCDLDPQKAFSKLCPGATVDGAKRAFASLALLAIALRL